MILALLAWVPEARAQTAPRCFPEAAPAIVDCVAGRIAVFWEQQGGLPVFGYPIGPEHQEQSSAGPLTVQLFERARLELHPEHQPPYDVLLGRLGADTLAAQGRDWLAFPKSAPSAPHYFAQTGHAIAPEFWDYWSGHGLEFDGQSGTAFGESLALFGMPLSEARIETSPTDRKPYLTQWFERARFEYHPENAGKADAVLLGLLQRELQSASRPAAQSAPQSDAQPGGFIQVAGAQLTRLGQPVLLKGANYYPQWRPWSDMWSQWDAPQIKRELRQAREDLGINAVRVLVPYNNIGKPNEGSKIAPELLMRLRELVQIAGSLDMRVLITLFDFSHDFPAAGSSVDVRHRAYLSELIPQFADDERIFAWDIHNEPDHYEIWRDGNPQKVLSWLGRMADLVHALAPKQLVTVGMGQHSNLWLPGPDGRRVIDYSDVVSMHSYDAGAISRELDEVRAHTAKPILVEEFGWPTGPACVENYSEATQAGLYQTVLSAAKDRAAGLFAWSLRDFDSQPTVRWDSREEHFGLYRADGSLKPAAREFQALSAPPLPSATVTHLPLSTTIPSFPDGPRAPLLVPGSEHSIKGEFRRAWELFDGMESLGLPLTEAFRRPLDGVIVQYFERGVLEYRRKHIGNITSEAEQLMRILKPVDLGVRYAGGRELPEAKQELRGPFLDFYNRINGAWRLGQPISAELTEDVNGTPTTVQYFQNGRLELNPATHAIVVSALGKWAWDAQCSATH
jgi:hypothetical protein